MRKNELLAIHLTEHSLAISAQTSPAAGAVRRKSGVPRHVAKANWASALVIASIALFLLSACSINVKKEANGEDKQVDIQTPIGGIHVSNDVNVSDVGLPVYPGARLQPKGSDGDDKTANVNISGPGFGVKVVALKYQSDDSPDKLLSFYRDKLKKYGKVLECHSSKHLDVGMKIESHDSDSNELTCKGDNGSNVELKVGKRDDQHIVAVERDGKGATFTLVYVRTHGKQADI